MSGAHRLKDPASLLAAAMAASGLLLVALGSKAELLPRRLGLHPLPARLQPRRLPHPRQRTPRRRSGGRLEADAVGFGMGSALPYRVVSTAMLLLGAWFLFVWIRRRVGDWPALLMTLPILFLGAAFEDLFWFSSITFLGSMACGLGMLVALDRRDKRRRPPRLRLAGRLDALLQPLARLRRRRRRRRRPAPRRPRLATARLRRRGAGRPLRDLVARLGQQRRKLGDAAQRRHHAALRARLLRRRRSGRWSAWRPGEGLPSPPGLDWGRPLAVALGALAAWRLYRIERIPRSLWVVLAIALAFWIFGGIAVKPGRVPWASRYQYPGAALVLLVAAGMLSGLKLDRRLLPPALIAVAVSLAGNGSSSSSPTTSTAAPASSSRRTSPPWRSPATRSNRASTWTKNSPTPASTTSTPAHTSPPVDAFGSPALHHRTSCRAAPSRLASPPTR